MHIGSIKIDSLLALAPMAGVSDIAFRMACRRQGAGLTYSEMVSSQALCYQDSRTLDLLKRSGDDHPFAVQIFGHDPEIMAKAAKKAYDLTGAEIIDINMGCPTPKIVSNGDGAALMRTPELAARIVGAVVGAVPVPVTVKLRKGWDKGSVNVLELAKTAQDNGAAAVCVHGRTARQFYSAAADWDIIAEVKRSLSIPVIANGDIHSDRAQGAQCHGSGHAYDRQRLLRLSVGIQGMSMCSAGKGCTSRADDRRALRHSRPSVRGGGGRQRRAHRTRSPQALRLVPERNPVLGLLQRKDYEAHDS